MSKHFTSKGSKQETSSKKPNKNLNSTNKQRL
jgi:hypothetical protein